jgi:hypothetical protein
MYQFLGFIWIFKTPRKESTNHIAATLVTKRWQPHQIIGAVCLDLGSWPGTAARLQSGPTGPHGPCDLAEQSIASALFVAGLSTSVLNEVQCETGRATRGPRGAGSIIDGARLEKWTRCRYSCSVSFTGPHCSSASTKERRRRSEQGSRWRARPQWQTTATILVPGITDNGAGKVRVVSELADLLEKRERDKWFAENGVGCSV